MKILIVDDSTENLAVLQAILARAGFSTATLSDAAMMFSRVFQEKPDLILCDVCMPGFDGPMITRMLKRLDTTAQIPILLCSSIDESDLAARSAACGADGYVRKTAAPREIVGAIRRALERSSSSRLRI